MSIERLSIVWNRITIDITYNKDCSKAHRKIMGFPMAHLEIMTKTGEQLPITDTGYRSHYTAASEIEDYGGAEKFVREWLDHKAQSKAWKDHIRQSNQLSLF